MTTDPHADPTGQRAALRRRRPGAAALLRLVLAPLLLGLGACASSGEDEIFRVPDPETKIAYVPELEGAPTDAMDALMRESLAIFRRQEEGAQSLAFLRRRAQGDIDTAQTILRSRGFYEAEVTVSVTDGAAAGGAADGTAGGATADGGPETPVATATLTIEPGRRFVLARHDLVLEGAGATPPPDFDAAELGSPVGRGARAAEIQAAEQAAVARLRADGRPYARFESRDAVADLEAATIEVTSRIAAGPFYTYGPLSFSGAPNVEDDYLASYRTWAEGAPISEPEITAFQRELTDTGLFRLVSVTPPEDPPPGDTAPIGVRLEEAPFRTIGGSLRFSTDEGPAARATFEHRNLFGANETLTLEAEASIDQQIAGATYLEPQYLRPGQDFLAGLELRRIDDDRFDELGATITAGLQRELGERWTVGAGGLLEFSVIDDTGEDRTAILGGIPVFASYDGTESELDPTRGQRLRLSATPFLGQFDEALTTFLVLEARGSAYQDILGDGRFVFAERARLGSIVADELDDVPPTRRFYSGGGGSVRGYEQDLIGPLDRMNDPTGGLSVAEVGLEFRGRIWQDIGGVVFLDGGIVGEDSVITGDEDFLVAAGTGLRYYSPVGPIRLDVAFPLNGHDVDDSFQVYFSIGQAF